MAKIWRRLLICASSTLMCVETYEDILNLSIEACKKIDNGQLLEHLDDGLKAKQVLDYVENPTGPFPNALYIEYLQRSLIPQYKLCYASIYKASRELDALQKRLGQLMLDFKTLSGSEARRYYDEFQSTLFEAATLQHSLLLSDNKYFAYLKALELLFGETYISEIELNYKVDLVKRFKEDLPLDLVSRLRSKLG